MTSRRLERMRAAPRANWTIADVEALCREFGVAAQPPRGGGSHFKISHPGLATILTIPFKRPIKPIYIRKLVALIDEVRSLHGTASIPDRD